jgi:hypothetical protein
MPRKPRLPKLDTQASVKMPTKLYRQIERLAIALGKHPATWMRERLAAAVEVAERELGPVGPRRGRRKPAMQPPTLPSALNGKAHHP